MGIKYRSPGKWSAFGTDASGNLVPGSGYKLYTYVPGTTTNKATYLDKNGTSSQTNPVVFDSRGEATIFWNGTYDLKLTDNNDVQIWTLSDFGAGEDYVNYGNYNLVSDGGFEDDTNGDGLPDQWTVTTYPTAGSGAGSAVLDSTTQIEGLNSLKFTSQGDGGGYAVSGFFNVREGSVLGLSWQMQSTAATVRNLVEVIWYTSAQVQISTSTIYDASTGNPTSWTEETGSATVPSTARFAKIRVTGCHSSVATTGSTWFDDVYVINNKTFSSSQLLANNVALQGEDTSAVAHNLIKLNTNNLVEIGDASLYSLEINGGYLCVVSSSNYYATGAYHNGTNWIATATSAQITDLTNRIHYVNTGLTIGNSFTPTAIFAIDATGKITTGKIAKFVSDTNYPVFNTTIYEVIASQTAATWESVGATGSGATNIWTALDSVPTDADWIELKMYAVAYSSAAGAMYQNIYGRKNGSALGISISSALIDQRSVAAAASEYRILVGTAKIQLSSRIFDLYYTQSNVTGNSISCLIMGYGYN